LSEESQRFVRIVIGTIGVAFLSAEAIVVTTPYAARIVGQSKANKMRCGSILSPEVEATQTQEEKEGETWQMIP
jgi:hypothetical protein